MYSKTKASDIRLGAAAVALTAAILAVGAVLPLAGWPIAVLVSRRRHWTSSPAQSKIVKSSTTTRGVPAGTAVPTAMR